MKSSGYFFCKIVYGCEKIIFYSARGVNRGVSVFPEGIILDDIVVQVMY
jgi:hypothetical protein